MKFYQKNTLCMVIILFLLCVPSIAFADESRISINMRRNFGSDFGNKIGGDWTIFGSGPEGTIKISIFFNETEVYTDQGKEYSFRFSTYDYQSGIMNITVRAYSSENEFVSRSIEREFIERSTENYIIIGAIAIVAIAIYLKYGLNRKKNRDAKKGVSVDQIKID